MQKQIHLLLGDLEIGQMLDGLEIREEAWRNTAKFLDTDEPPTEFFLPEECSNSAEAENIAKIYRAIIEKIRKQLKVQKSAGKTAEVLTPPKEGVATGFAIYIETVAEGRVPVERSETNLAIVYPTELAAQREIAGDTIERLRQFLVGERDFDDAISVEEYVASVDLHPDGSVTDEDGRKFK